MSSTTSLVHVPGSQTEIPPSPTAEALPSPKSMSSGPASLPGSVPPSSTPPRSRLASLGASPTPSSDDDDEHAVDDGNARVISRRAASEARERYESEER